VPVVAGLMANDAWAIRNGLVEARSILPVRALQSGLLALFAASYVRAVLAGRSARGLVPERTDRHQRDGS